MQWNDKQNIKRLKEELAIDATQDGLWDWNCLTNEVYFSTRWKEMLGYEDHEIKNDLEEWKSRVHPDDLDQALSDLQKHFNGEEDYYVNEHRLRCKDGSYKWILDRGKAIFDDEKKPLRMSGFHTDITTRKLLEDQLRLMEKNLSTQLTMELSNKMKLKHTNKELEAQLHQEIIKRQEKEEMLLVQTRQAAMGEMISMIAHQWRQPITIIGLGVDNTLLDIALGKVDEKDLEENLNMIRQQVDYLSQTIDDFKNFFTPNKEKELVSLRTCIDASLNIIGKSLFQHSVEIQKDYNDNSTLELFKNEVIQVFLNILKNSQDVFIQKQIVNPKLIIQTSEDEKNIIVKIQDNGGGIDPQYIEKIYEPYFTSKSKYNGTGLGLYMTKTIIEDHCCGKITATNKNDGVEFEILFPKHCNKNNLQH
jgi:PAS domain S-box-containing protein